MAATSFTHRILSGVFSKRHLGTTAAVASQELKKKLIEFTVEAGGNHHSATIDITNGQDPSMVYNGPLFKVNENGERVPQLDASSNPKRGSVIIGHSPDNGVTYHPTPEKVGYFTSHVDKNSLPEKLGSFPLMSGARRVPLHLLFR